MPETRSGKRLSGSKTPSSLVGTCWARGIGSRKRDSQQTQTPWLSISPALIERAQFAQNTAIYEKKNSTLTGDFEGSFMEWMLRETEVLHGETTNGHSICSSRALKRSDSSQSTTFHITGREPIL
jgi:hypothetical protein